MEVSLDDIINGCRKGDLSLQKLLYKKYFNLFMGMSMRYVSRREDAEEILNNAFLRIFRYISKYNNTGSFEGWMKRIVVNCCLDYIKGSQYLQQGKVISLHNNYQDGYVPGHETENPGNTSNNLAVEKYDRQYLLDLLQHLPEVTRTVFNLYVFEEYSHREIGQTLDMAERTSQAHLAKARQLLTERLDKKKLMLKLERV